MGKETPFADVRGEKGRELEHEGLRLNGKKTTVTATMKS